MGDLSPEEAYIYVHGGVIKDVNGDDVVWPGLLSQSEKTPKLDEEDWKNVHSVCGGNIRQLDDIVRFAIKTGSWEKGRTQFLFF